MSEEAWQQRIDLNLNSVHLTCHAVLPIMEKQGSGIVNNNAGYYRIEIHRHAANCLCICKSSRYPTHEDHCCHVCATKNIYIFD